MTINVLSIGVTRSPIFNHLATTFNGLSSVRAYRAQERFEAQFDIHLDQHSATWYIELMSITLMRD